MKRYSKYNYHLDYHGDKMLLYNTCSDQIMVVENKLFQLFTECAENPQRLENLHPQFFESLNNKGFIVDDGVDEYEREVARLKDEAENNRCPQITINPTLDCNLRCWYCYEGHLCGSRMSEETFNSVKLFLEKTLASDATERMVVSFFGGEPLMYYREVVRPLIAFMEELKAKYNKNIDYYMTTNGTLLTKEVVDDLVDNRICLDLQVAFDGNESEHNKTKFFKDKSGSFAVVRDNVLYAVEKGLPVLVRCNYTDKNIDSFKDFVTEFESVKDKENVEFKFHKVWQAKGSDNLHKSLLAVKEAMSECDYTVSDQTGQKGTCYADKKRNLVINYDGCIYKCTARNFKPEISIGKLTSGGDIVYNGRITKWSDVKYKSAACRDCIIFPICGQTCTQNVMERKGYDGCVADNSEKTIDKIIRSRLSTIISDI